MNFARQLQRASLRQEMEVLQETCHALHAENHQLEMENKSLFRAMGAMVAVSGGEIRIPRDMGDLLKGKNLVSDAEGDEFVFRIVDVPAQEGSEEEEKESEETATTE